MVGYNSIHDIRVDNALSQSKKEKLNLMNIPIKNTYTELKKQFVLNPNEFKDSDITTRFTKRNLYKFSDVLLRKTYHYQKNIIENKSLEKENFTILQIHNEKREDENLINECIQKHFFMKYLN